MPLSEVMDGEECFDLIGRISDFLYGEPRAVVEVRDEKGGAHTGSVSNKRDGDLYDSAAIQIVLVLPYVMDDSNVTHKSC